MNLTPICRYIIGVEETSAGLSRMESKHETCDAASVDRRTPQSSHPEISQESGRAGRHPHPQIHRPPPPPRGVTRICRGGVSPPFQRGRGDLAPTAHQSRTLPNLLTARKI